MFEFKRGARHAGTVVPVFSLRSRRSAGVGDFADLRLLVDWAEATGQHVIQILPVNDTISSHDWRDSYPYSAVSVMALHPLYLDIRDIGFPAGEEFRIFEDEARELNALPQVDYERVIDLKLRCAEAAFSLGRDAVAESGEYRDFFERNRSWLVSYADFCVARDGKGTREFHYFLQYHLDRQLRTAHEYANLHGVALKGDVPIGIKRDSVDALDEPWYFNLDMQAGAPPDFYSSDGQNWGFPTYDWDRMAEDGYSWWRRRFAKMAEYFDAYRIDHILGFFRIWEIPVPEKSGKMGHFSPALTYSREEALGYVQPWQLDECFIEDPRCKGRYHPRIDACDTEAVRSMPDDRRGNFIGMYDDFFYHRNDSLWRDEAMRKLPSLVSSTGMLACAEDLGMVPDCVGGVLKELGILALNVQRWPKEYSYLCVATTGTHDADTLRGWWASEHGGEDPSVDICRGFVERCLCSEAMLAIIPLQDWMSMNPALRLVTPAQERINDPANPNHYWRYRMPVMIEDLIDDNNFNELIKTLTANGGRE